MEMNEHSFTVANFALPSLPKKNTFILLPSNIYIYNAVKLSSDRALSVQKGMFPCLF